MSNSDAYPRCYLSEPVTHEDSVTVEATPTTHAKYYMPEEEIRYVSDKEILSWLLLLAQGFRIRYMYKGHSNIVNILIVNVFHLYK